MHPTTKTSYERYLNDNPPMEEPRYTQYVARGGKSWGHYYRETFPKEFNKNYEDFWLKNPSLWDTDCEL